MRVMENNIPIKVAFSNSTPLGVDTKEDLEKVKKEMSHS
jgi:CMP-2-keto-3-deoxyoctulosonic acid synthetase